MKRIHPNELHERNIEHIYSIYVKDSSDKFNLINLEPGKTITIPNHWNLLTFEVPVLLPKKKEETYLFLAHGGLDIPKIFLQRIFQTSKPDFGIAIEKTSGRICIATFYIEKISKNKFNTSIWLSPFLDADYFVPKKWLVHLEDLACEQNPYELSFEYKGLMDFVDNEIGFKELKSKTNIVLNFKSKKTFVEISRDYHSRELSNWL